MPTSMCGACPPTKNPLLMFTIQVHFPPQFTRHLAETLDRIRYAVDRFEAFTYGPVDCRSGGCEL
jgi:hypothetical protein